MYLSRILLDINRRETLKALASPNIFHGAIEKNSMGNSGYSGRNLWRIDYLNGNYYLLLLSAQKRDLSNIYEQFGPKDGISWQTKAYSPLLDRLQVNEKWHFRLCANPTRSVKIDQDRKQRGKIVAHVSREHQRAWLMQRAEKNGFYLEPNDFDIVGGGWENFIKFRRKRQDIVVKTAIFEGILTIKDLSLFKQTLTCGIGRAKAYGCGLLTIAPIRLQT